MDLTQLIGLYDAEFRRRYGGYLGNPNDKNPTDAIIASNTQKFYDKGLAQLQNVKTKENTPNPVDQNLINQKYGAGGPPENSDAARQLQVQQQQYNDQTNVGNQIANIVGNVGAWSDIAGYGNQETPFAQLRKKRAEAPGQRASLVAPQTIATRSTSGKRTLISGY